MTSIAHVETAMNEILNERANVLAKETGAIQGERKFGGADLLQTLVFGWMQHPDASLEMLSSTAAIRAVKVSDTAVDKRFTPKCADFLHAVLEALLQVVVQAEEVVPPKALRAFPAVVLEDSSTIVLPDELAQLWRGCGGNQAHTRAALKLHVRLRAQAGTALGTSAQRGTLFRSSQSSGEAGVAQRQFVRERFGVLLLARDRAAEAAAGLHADALASRHCALHCQGQTAHVSTYPASARGADERDARAGRSPGAAAHAAPAAPGAQGHRGQASAGSARRCEAATETDLGGDLAPGRLDDRGD